MYEAALDFLRTVLPSTGRYVGAVQRPGGGFLHSFHDTVEALAHHQITADEAGKTAYFALGAFGPANVREATNVVALRSLWVDIDVGEAKAAEGRGYATFEAARQALDEFVAAGFPPVSVVVSSGYGLHAYWVLTADAAPAQWRITADAFQRAWQSHELRADPISADAARVLRVPGTHNRKYNTAVPVTLVESTGELHTLADLHQAAGRVTKAPVAPRSAKIAALESNDDLLANLPRRESHLSSIVRFCKQVRQIASNRGATCSEPLWFASVQLARHLVSGTEAAMYLSSGHPDFSEEAVLVKLDHLAGRDIGPTTCAKFKSLNPAGCADCPRNVTSPIQLGERAPEPVAPVITIQEVELADGVEQLVERELTAPVDPPKGFMFTEDGTAAEVIDDKGVHSWVTIFPGHIFPTRIFRAPGRPLEVEIYSRRAGTGEINKFSVPAAKLGDAKETRNTLMGHVMIDSASAAMLQKLINAMSMQIQNKSRTGLAARQFGWQMGDPAVATHFVWGRRRFTPEGTEHNIPVDEAIAGMADRLCVRGGTLDGAKAGAELYNKPGGQMHQAAYLTGLVGVFAPFLGPDNFATLALFADRGGEGKTTNCMAALSHWFPPSMALSTARDTANALFHTMSCRGTLPVYIDEVVTNTTPDAVARATDLLYTAASGKEKSRMEQSGAKQREPLPPWRCPLLTSANKSLRELVRTTRGDPSALYSRVLEVTYVPLDLTKQERDQIQRVFHDNYGHTGPLVAEYVARNLPAVRKMTDHVRDKFIAAQGDPDGADRFWINWAVGVVMACHVMRHLNLVSYDTNLLFEYANDLMNQQKAQKKAGRRTCEDVLAEFLGENTGRLLIGDRTDGVESAARLTTYTDRIIPGGIVGRSQLDEHVLYVSDAALRKFCAANGHNFGTLMAQFSEAGLLAKSYVRGVTDEGRPRRVAPAPAKYALGRGTPYATAPMTVVAFSLDHDALRDHMRDAREAVKGPTRGPSYVNDRA